MRIRKHVRKISVGIPPGDSLVYCIYKGWDRDVDSEKSSQTNSAGATFMEESWVDFLTTSRRHSFPAVERDFVKPHGVEDLSASKDELELASEVEHLTRHYVRRSVRKDADGAASVQSEFPIANVIAAAKQNERKRDDVDASQQCEPSEVLHGTMRAERLTSIGKICKPPATEPFHNKENQDHPSKEPEGSLLHSLYLQLLAASKEGLTLRELFASFKIQASLPSLASDWKDQVRLHLKRNQHFGELKGRYFLSEQLAQLKRRSSSKLAKSRITGRKSSVKADPQLFKSAATPTPVYSSYNSDDVHEGMQTRRKAYQNTIEAALTQSAMEFQKLQQGTGQKELTTSDLRALSSVVAPHIEGREIKSSPKPVSVVKKRKSKSGGDEDYFRSVKFGRATPGSLIALQAKIVAETGVQSGVRCARKDGCRNWQCPLMAMEDHALCEHHKFLKERKRDQHAEAKKKKKEKRRRLEGTEDFETGLPKSCTSSDEPDSSIAESGIRDFAKQEIAEVGDAHIVQALVELKSHVPTEESQHETLSKDEHRPVVRLVKDDEPKRTSEKLLQHLVTSAPKRRHVAAKKTAANVAPVKDKSQESEIAQPIRLPSIPPLPPQYGFRRKTVKNKSLLSF